jgi:hypothetical protein
MDNISASAHVPLRIGQVIVAVGLILGAVTGCTSSDDTNPSLPAQSSATARPSETAQTPTADGIDDPVVLQAIETYHRAQDACQNAEVRAMMELAGQLEPPEGSGFAGPGELYGELRDYADTLCVEAQMARDEVESLMDARLGDGTSQGSAPPLNEASWAAYQVALEECYAARDKAERELFGLLAPPEGTGQAGAGELYHYLRSAADTACLEADQRRAEAMVG